MISTKKDFQRYITWYTLLKFFTIFLGIPFWSVKYSNFHNSFPVTCCYVFVDQHKISFPTVYNMTCFEKRNKLFSLSSNLVCKIHKQAFLRWVWGWKFFFSSKLAMYQISCFLLSPGKLSNNTADYFFNIGSYVNQFLYFYLTVNYWSEIS